MSSGSRFAEQVAATGSATVSLGEEGRAGPQTRKGVLTRARLLDAAKVVFERDGFLEARIAEIAEAADLAQGSFHHYWRAESAIRLLQLEGGVDRRLDPAIAADALGAMVGRLAELWLVQGYREYDFDAAVEQLTVLWANALGMSEEPVPNPSPQETAP